MKRIVLGQRKKLKILKSIVEFVTILVMDNLKWSWSKFSSKMLLNDKPMFHHIFAIDVNSVISISIDASLTRFVVDCISWVTIFLKSTVMFVAKFKRYCLSIARSKFAEFYHVFSPSIGIVEYRTTIPILLLLLLPLNAGAYGRSGSTADSVFLSDGDTREPFSVIVDSGSAVQVYDAYMTGYADRSIVIENTHGTFDVFCGTHPDVRADSGPRFLLPPTPDRVKTYGNYDIYCIADPLAESFQIEILGEITYDTKD